MTSFRFQDHTKKRDHFLNWTSVVECVTVKVKVLICIMHICIMHGNKNMNVVHLPTIIRH